MFVFLLFAFAVVAVVRSRSLSRDSLGIPVVRMEMVRMITTMVSGGVGGGGGGCRRLCW